VNCIWPSVSTEHKGLVIAAQATSPCTFDGFADHSVDFYFVRCITLYTTSFYFCAILHTTLKMSRKRCWHNILWSHAAQHTCSCRLTKGYHGFFFLSSFLRQLPLELAERNSTKTGHMLRRKCDLKRHVRNIGYPLPYKSGALKPPFSTILQLKGNFNGLYIRNVTWHT